MKIRRRENLSVRKEEILNAAIMLAAKIGYNRITREHVASCAGTSCALVTHYFGNMQQLKQDVLKAAIRREIYLIIAQGLSLGEPLTKTISKELKDKVLAFLTN